MDAGYFWENSSKLRSGTQNCPPDEYLVAGLEAVHEPLHGCRILLGELEQVEIGRFKQVEFGLGLANRLYIRPVLSGLVGIVIDFVSFAPEATSRKLAARMPKAISSFWVTIFGIT